MMYGIDKLNADQYFAAGTARTKRSTDTAKTVPNAFLSRSFKIVKLEAFVQLVARLNAQLMFSAERLNNSLYGLPVHA